MPVLTRQSSRTDPEPTEEGSGRRRARRPTGEGPGNRRAQPPDKSAPGPHEGGLRRLQPWVVALWLVAEKVYAALRRSMAPAPASGGLRPDLVAATLIQLDVAAGRKVVMLTRHAFVVSGSVTDRIADVTLVALRALGALTQGATHVTAVGVTATASWAVRTAGWITTSVAAVVIQGRRLAPVGVEYIRDTVVPALLRAAAATMRGLTLTAEALATTVRLVTPHCLRLGRRLALPTAAVTFLLMTGALLGGPLLQLASHTVDVTSPDTGGLPTLVERSVVHAADGSTLAILHGEVDRRVVPLDQIPDHVHHAVLAAEDRRFAQHDGYDLEAVGRASLANLRAGAVIQGGSTITQQLAKQHFTDGSPTMERKARELLHAIALEREYTKPELLEHYLNQVYFGAGAYGIAAAAEEFFGVMPEELAPSQAATLAGLIRAPNSLNPHREPELATERRNQVLDAMAAEGLLPSDEAEALAGEPLELGSSDGRTVSEPHAVEAIKREFLADPAFGEDRAERAELLFTGGLEIRTTIDPGLQAAAAEAVAAYQWDSGPGAALAAVEPGSGRIRALHTGAEFETEQFDYATQARRQPGSAFKPLVAAAALEAGASPSQQLTAKSPATFDLAGDASWRVGNYEGRSSEPVDMTEAMRDSVNTAFVQLALGVGVEAVAETAERMGIDVDAALGPEGSYGPSMALGGLTNGVSPLEMASAYAVFADSGQYHAPFLIEKVSDRSGQELLHREPEADEALSGAVNDELIAQLTEVVDDGTGQRAQLEDWQVAGKTGTTQDNADGWFVGATAPLSTAVWIGYPDSRRSVPGMTGGGAPTMVWHSFMLRALADHEPEPLPLSDDGSALGGGSLSLPDPR